MYRQVAPLVGAWIEIVIAVSISDNVCVAPLVGAWIEIKKIYEPNIEDVSLPLWERGLKFLAYPIMSFCLCRSPCGSVD